MLKLKKFFGLSLLVGTLLSAVETDHKAVYSDCLKEYGTMNNTVVHVCATNASESAKREITSLYAEIYKMLAASSAEEAAAFEATQKAWIVYRNGHCELAGQYIGSPMYSYCPMEMNIARALELRQLAGQ